jgi:hypothetical protein
MRTIAAFILMIGISMSQASGKVAVFWQEGFPTLESQPVPRETIEKALNGLQPEFVSLEELNKPAALHDVELLVLPYGSAVPADAWAAVLKHLQAGGNLLILGGRPLTIPVHKGASGFVVDRPETAYSRQIGVEHTYEAPRQAGPIRQSTDVRPTFTWKDGTFSGGDVQAKRVFVIEGVSYGLGYLQDSAGERVAAPVVATDFTSLE